MSFSKAESFRQDVIDIKKVKIIQNDLVENDRTNSCTFHSGHRLIIVYHVMTTTIQESQIKVEIWYET